MPLNEHDLQYLWSIHSGEPVDRERRRTAGMFDPSRSWVDGDGYRLSDRVWRIKGEVREKIDQMIVSTLESGGSAIDLATQLEQFLNPNLAPVRTKSGRIRRRQAPGVLTHAPQDAYGVGSYPARRLARTEITFAHGAAVNEASRIAGAATEWGLSPSHPEMDICDEHAANHSKGLAPGQYWPDELPSYPAHPHDLCHLVTVDPRTDDEILAAIWRESGIEDIVEEDRRAGRIPPWDESKVTVSQHNPGARRLGHTVWNEDSLPVTDWESAGNRVVLPKELQDRLGVPTPVLRWKTSKRNQVLNKHAVDRRQITHIEEMLEKWEYAGLENPEVSTEHWNVFFQDEGHWFMAVFGRDSETGSMNMVTVYSAHRQNYFPNRIHNKGIPKR